MRKLETPTLEVYYPASRRALALRAASRLEHCLQSLRALPLSRAERDKALVYVTSANFNNAYVQPDYVGHPAQMVLPQHVTLEFFNLLGFGAGEVDDISCHEAVHYVQLQQTDGFWKVVNSLFGGLIPNNAFTESWFLEGLAVHYEGSLGKAVGRPHSAIWRGVFESGVAVRGGNLGPGDLSPDNRDESPFGGNYLVGMHFIDFLASKYGEEKLWQLIDVQGRAILSPLGVTLRFKAVYGKSVGALFDEFSEELKANLRPRHRPLTQVPLSEELGPFARMTASPGDGAIATVSARRTDVVRLTVQERDGSIRFSRRLTQILPLRRWISSDPLDVSGMSFTADGRWLFLVFADVDTDTSFTARLWQVDATNGDVVRTWSKLGGFGGTVSPDGNYYVYVQMDGDTANLARIELATDRRELLTHFDGRSTLGAPSYSPEGKRIVFSRWTGEGFDLFLRQEDGALKRLTFDGAFNYSARWLDSDHLIFLRNHRERVQVHGLEITSGVLTTLTDAPYVALDPSPVGGDQIVLLNRDGWSWTVDRAPILPLETHVQVDAAAAEGVSLSQPPTILSDTPYSSLDHLFQPYLRAPSFLLLPDQSHKLKTVFATVSLQGSDRLGFHNYAFNLIYDSSESHDVSLNAGYGNYWLAPWFLSVVAGRNRSDPTTDLSATLRASRTFWTTPVELKFTALDRLDQATADVEATRTRFVGVGASIHYFAGESSLYGGTQRGLGISLASTVYSRAIGSNFDVGDLRGELNAFLPLPLLHRHSFLVTVRGRTLLGAPAGLLRVGGLSTGLFQRTLNGQPSAASAPLNLPEGVSFSEYLRGYEDYLVRGTSTVIVGARYRYSFIIDRGSASLFYVMPSFFVRQIDVEGFAEGARLNNPFVPLHRSAGAAIFLRTTIGQVLPITLFYQFAGRFDDELGPLHIFGLSLE
jgi:hypothetical protein